MVSDNEVIQIIAARAILFLLFLASGYLLYRIARHFVNRTGALFAVLCWVSFSNVILHAASLRYDSFCSFFFLLACFVLLKENGARFWSAIAGIAMGISLLISLKAAIHVGSLVTLFLTLGIFSERKMPIFHKGALFLALMALTFALGFTLHQNSLPLATTASQQTFVQHAAAKAFSLKEFFPRWEYFTRTLRNNPFIWSYSAVGFFFLIIDIIRGRDKKCLIALSFLPPLLSLPFYRNAFPYYYVFIISPAIFFCGILPHRLIEDFKKSGSNALLFLFALIYLPIVGGAGTHFLKAFNQNNKSQKELLTVIHKMFPDPVSYIDGCFAVASYPGAGFFMSTWVMENYLATGKPVFREILKKKHPQFLLANTPYLDSNFSRDHSFFKINYDLLEEDRKTLGENYVQHCGIVLVPGKILKFKKKGEQKNFEILIPGYYFIQSDGEIIFDTKYRGTGEKIIFLSGIHKVQSTKNVQKIVLRWARINDVPCPPNIATMDFFDF